MATRTVHPIASNWHFRQSNSDKQDASATAAVAAEWLPVSQFPTHVHLDLLHHGLIPDPNIGKNEVEVQWVGEAVWSYKTTFTTPDAALDGPTSKAKAVLAFDGLDTFATVLLNGVMILETDNMFIPERVDVTDKLKKAENGGNENVLEISFDSAYLRGWKLVEEHPDHKWGCWNGDDSRLGVRKAQYHWGWDWGPTLLTCGPWRPVNLEIYSARIADLSVQTTVSDALGSAKVVASAETEGEASKVEFEISLDDNVVASETVDIAAAPASDGTRTTTATFNVEKPSLWYPASYGAQPLYTITATLLSSSSPPHLDTQSKRIGLRKAELVQDPLEGQPGTSFFFRINNTPIFAGGSDWIPADNFIPRISPSRYHDWVRLLREGNQNMIRVWGGGIYEEHAFYSACDEQGVLVWQDFMFGCGNYPAWPALLDSIKREADVNVRRLRHHPSIVLWAGNNEDYQYAESEKLQWDPSNNDSESWLSTDFPARYIYEKILPDACAALVPDTYYHPGSPWGGAGTRDPTIGDIHQWNVWHGSQEKYQDFDKLGGRFVSEFGMEAFPSVKTIDAFLPGGKSDPDRFPQSSTIDFHNKADGHERRIALYLVENLRYAPDPLDHFVYCTQLMQAECLSSAYRLWKREWKGPRREYCAGALVWQSNDCWPVTSWAIVDYFLRPKHAYFTVKREMAPLSVGMTRREHRQARDKYTRVHVDVRNKIEIWGSNLRLDDVEVHLVVKGFDVETGEETHSETRKRGVLLPENRSTEMDALDVPVPQGKPTSFENRVVVAAYLVDADTGKQLARYVNWPEPLKYLHLQKPKHLRAELASDFSVVRISAEVPVKGLALECDDDTVIFEDNLIDLVPGETVEIKVKGATGGTVLQTRYLNMLN